MADFTKYELEKIKLQKKADTQKDLLARKKFKIKLAIIGGILAVGLVVISILIKKGDEALEDAMKEDVPQSKEWNVELE